eukprot:169966-Prymnesium_polylepis.1
MHDTTWPEGRTNLSPRGCEYVTGKRTVRGTTATHTRGLRCEYVTGNGRYVGQRLHVSGVSRRETALAGGEHRGVAKRGAPCDARYHVA